MESYRSVYDRQYYKNLDKSDKYYDSVAYHRTFPAGKLEVVPTKSLVNQYDLSLAYSPGVAGVCHLIDEDPTQADFTTARSNLVGLITNGTAVLGLGDIGPLAAKPVMEGKAVLFKKFSGIDVFDIEVKEKDIDAFCKIVEALEPTFGGINLEDIKAPECFEIERRLSENMNIPVFHDDQHGTAIIVSAALLNAMEIVHKDLSSIRIVCSGAGAAALSCLSLLEHIGVRRENIRLFDRSGLVYKGRSGINVYKEPYMAEKDMTFGEALDGADVFLGLSSGGALSADLLLKMARDPIIFALANPIPEIFPDEALKVRSDAICATGRSDYPNQVNNVLCFPFIFRGALDVAATKINIEMKLACVRALAALAHREVSSAVQEAYGGSVGYFGRDYLIPKPFDSRLISEIAPAVALAAMETGVAKRPIQDMKLYKQSLIEMTDPSFSFFSPVMDVLQSSSSRVRVVYSDGEDERVLLSLKTILEDSLASPILVGRRYVIEAKMEKLGLQFIIGKDFELCDPENDSRYLDYWSLYHKLCQRDGVSVAVAKADLRWDTTLIAALMVLRGEADALVCGGMLPYAHHVRIIESILGKKDQVSLFASMNTILLKKSRLFFADVNVNLDPTAEQLSEIAYLAASSVENFGVEPRVAFLSHSNFGSFSDSRAVKVRQAREIFVQKYGHIFPSDGEMSPTTALFANLQKKFLVDGAVCGEANTFVFPSMESARIASDFLSLGSSSSVIGPIFLGCSYPVHILLYSSQVQDVIQATALLSTHPAERKRHEVVK